MVMTRRQEDNCRTIMTRTKDEGHSKITQDYKSSLVRESRPRTKTLFSQNRRTQLEDNKNNLGNV
jgi:hypothetical protein